ncbi:MAG: hypothetical protein H8D56_23650 [Planctomycetes bacterium]|nr:hypothetical protein [Planctomycetota bacterium]MBL7145884.1 hypothetical protein [Phycisphaerae bacterium]
MPIADVITSSINMIILALTPIERWKAAGQQETGLAEHWFILIGVALIIILTVLLLIVSYNRITREQKINGQLFFDFSEQRGLSGRECQILLKIAQMAGLKRNQAIFSMVSAFDAGAKKMIEECLAKQGAEESKWLRTELSFLREKLCFHKNSSVSIGSPSKLKKPSSRHILTGKKLYITRRTSHNLGDLSDLSDLSDIESIVIKNDNMELTIKLTTPVESKLGELWRVRYSFGSSVWEFDSSVVRCNDDILVLNHSDNIRFISRRRFLRVQVNKPAFIAHFPFSKTLSSNNNTNSKKGPAIKQSSVLEPDNWGPPEFMPATVTELGGPGLRIESNLEVKVGDRVLVIVNLSEEKVQDLNPSSKSTSLHSVLSRDRKSTPSKIVEDIGEVKHVRALQNCSSIAVELTGLNDSDINDLIRATNAAYKKISGKSKDAPNSIESEEIVSEPVVAQGE